MAEKPTITTQDVAAAPKLTQPTRNPAFRMMGMALHRLSLLPLITHRATQFPVQAPIP